VTNPQPEASAGDLDGTLSRRDLAARAGLPANFFVINPDVDDANVTDSGAYSDCHALQIELRRRLSKGLQANVNYQYALAGGSAFLGFQYGRVLNPTANVRHAIKTQWDWTIPVGQGQLLVVNHRQRATFGDSDGLRQNASSRPCLRSSSLPMISN